MTIIMQEGEARYTTNNSSVKHKGEVAERIGLEETHPTYGIS